MTETEAFLSHSKPDYISTMPGRRSAAKAAKGYHKNDSDKGNGFDRSNAKRAMILQGNIDNDDADDDDGAFDDSNDGNAEFGDGNAASDDDSMDDFDEGDGYDAHAHYDDLSLKCDWDDGDDDRDRGILVNVNEGDGGEDDGGEKIDVPRKD